MCCRRFFTCSVCAGHHDITMHVVMLSSLQLHSALKSCCHCLQLQQADSAVSLTSRLTILCSCSVLRSKFITFSATSVLQVHRTAAVA